MDAPRHIARLGPPLQRPRLPRRIAAFVIRAVAPCALILTLRSAWSSFSCVSAFINAEPSALAPIPSRHTHQKQSGTLLQVQQHFTRHCGSYGCDNLVARQSIKRAAKGKKAPDPSEVDVVITPRAEDYSEWYLSVIAASDLIDDAPVRGCKVLKPNGFAIWEGIKDLLDPKLKKIGVQNAYFPLLIPVSFLSKEAEHVEGFAKECAVVTHHRLRSKAPEDGADGTPGVEVDPDSKLVDPYVIRPTSETMVWHMYGRWIRNHRDLPVKMNQWVNVMRWEMRTRPFLRSAEFLWQEGHTAHATAEEADLQAREVLDLYIDLPQGQLALPLIPGRKSARERFAGAVETYTIEALAQDGKAIQAGTSHYLGQNFAKAFDVTYQTEEMTDDFVWATSWGVSTRLLGAVIMAHSDDDGLVLPPTVAAIQVVIVPLYAKKADKQAEVNAAAEKLLAELEDAGLRVRLDSRLNMRPGAKYYEWERKGVPLRLELGNRDLEKGTTLAKMRTGGDKFPISLENAKTEVVAALDSVQNILRERSQSMKERLTFRIQSKAEFEERLKANQPGFLLVPWGGDSDDEEKIQEDTGATLRCYPLEQDPIPDGQICPLTGKPAQIWAVFAAAY